MTMRPSEPGHKLTARPGTARAVIIAMRRKRPHADIYGLFRQYESNSENRHIGWTYFLSVCRDFDAVTALRRGRDG